jgi:hypothetical protein
MILNINSAEVRIQENESNIKGLKFIPQITNFGPKGNDEDQLPFSTGFAIEVSPSNFFLTEELTKKYAKHHIVEIGVHRNGQNSFTRAMLNHKPKNSKYLGIDLESKTFLNNQENNIYTIQANSFEQERVRAYMHEIGIDKISIFFIDGWHSVNTIINDWKYTDLLADDGIVIFHDTNYHPGPPILLEAIDKNLYDIKKYFENDRADCGMAVAFKK